MDVRLFCPCVRVRPPPFVSTADYLTRHTSFSHIPSRYGSFYSGLDTYPCHVIYLFYEMRKTTIAGSEAQTSLISLVVGVRFPTLPSGINARFLFLTGLFCHFWQEMGS
jgi:hypothetical protein